MADHQLVEGNEYEFEAVGVNDAGREAPVTGTTFESSDDAVFTVGGGGVAEAVAAGDAELTVTADPGGDAPTLEKIETVQVITAAQAASQQNASLTQTTATLAAQAGRATALRVRKVRINA